MTTRTAAALAALLAGAALAAAAPASGSSFVNDTPIEIGATPTSSAIEVSGETGRVTKVTVMLRKFSHKWTSDVDVLLVSPDGKTSLVMSDSCGVIDKYYWTFSQDFPGRMGVGGDKCEQFGYQPSDAASQPDEFPGAPPGPFPGFPNLYPYTFDGFIGSTPNGTWRLFVSDDVPDKYDGSIDLGWGLILETADADGVVPATHGGDVADPYPLTREVSGKSGVITDLDVKLGGVYHQRPADMDLLLVGPRGQRVELMSNVCGGGYGSAVRNFTWTLDDEAPGAMPADACADGGHFRPAVNSSGQPLPPPAPQDEYEAALSAFDFTDPNGEWRLYAADTNDEGNDGFFGQRFALDIKTRPAADVSFAQSAVNLAEGEKRQLTLTRPADGREIGRGEVTVTSAAGSATSGTDFKPVSKTIGFAPGQTSRTVPVEALVDDAVEPDESFTVTMGQPTGDAAIGKTASATVTIRGQEVPPAPTGDSGTPATGDDGGGSPVAGEPSLAALTVSALEASTTTAQTVERRLTIEHVTLSPATFTLGRSRTARRTGRSATIAFTLSEPAAVTLQIQRRKRKRFATVGTLRREGRAGANRVAFAGRIGGRALGRGSYRVIVAAVDAAGNRATAPPKPMRIV